jgi:VWFA-related protein
MSQPVKELTMGRLLVPALVASTLTAVVAAQQSDYQVEVRLIQIEARVTDRQGHPIPDLGRADFVIKEGGVVHDVATTEYMPGPERLMVRSDTSPGTYEAIPIAGPVPQPTWIYISTEVGPSDTQRAAAAIRQFVVRQMQPGFQVSLGGMPFTTDKAQLAAAVDSMVRNPHGSAQRGALVDPTYHQRLDAENDRAMASEFRQQEEGIVPLQGFVARPEKVEGDAQYARPYVTEQRIDRQLPMYAEVTLDRYQMLVDQLSTLPGKKVIVVLRPGLRVEADNSVAMQRLASSAVRHRVSFYTVDSRALEAIIPADELRIPLSIDRRRRPNVDVFRKYETLDISHEGLQALAEETGGRSVVNTNALEEVFDRLVHDASGYYVLSYYPVDLTAAGRYRRIDVSVKRPGVKIQATRGYYEPQPTTPLAGGDKGVALRRALLADVPRDLGVIGSANVFADEQRRPVLILSAGVRAGDLEPRQEVDDAALATTALVRIATEDGSRTPIYYERRVTSRAAKKSWGHVRSDQTAVVSIADLVRLDPGAYTWRVVFRDERTGKIGGAEGRVQIPDLSQPAASSTLLITREAVLLGEGEQPDLLGAGSLGYAPQPGRVFRQGDVVHLRFDLYNAPSAELDAAAVGPRMALLRDGKAVENVAFHAVAFPARDEGTVRFVGAIDTAHLVPGSYTVIAAPPAGPESANRRLVQIFQLLPKS